VVGALGLATATVVATGMSTAEADTTAAHRCRPVGTWSLDVTLVELGRHETSHYAFTGDGVVIHISNNGLIGLGAWRATGASTFSLSFREFVLASDGTVEGELRVHVDCTLTNANTLTGVGHASTFDLNGNLLYSVHSTATGAKFGLEG
jgi:hypothetical protein